MPTSTVSEPHLSMIRRVRPRTPNRYARAHARSAGHPIVRSFEPGESWRWCYVDEQSV